MREWRNNSLRDFLRRLVLFDESPHRTSLAFAVGVFFGFSPFWGIHTVLGLIAAFVARLNRVAVLIGVWTNTPWTMAPAASVGTALGFLMLGMEVRLPDLPEKSLVSSEFLRGAWSEFRYLIWPFLIGNMVLAVGAGALAYLAMKGILLRNRAMRKGRSNEDPEYSRTRELKNAE